MRTRSLARHVRTFFPLALATVFISCGGGSPAPVLPSPLGTPTIIFSASTNAITAGQIVTLIWRATNATSVTVTASSGSTSRTVTTSSQPSGKVNDSPTQNTTYSAVAAGAGGSSSQPQTTTVKVAPPPFTLSLSASPDTITSGQQVTLTWQVTGGTASALSVDPGVCGPCALPQGSATVTPIAATTYAATATAADGNLIKQTATVTVLGSVSGVLQWKGDTSTSGLYSHETTLMPSNVNVTQFGRRGSFKTDGLLIAQPLYVASVNMDQAGTHDVIIVATENESVYALDADNLGAGPLWQRNYLDPAHGITPLPDNFGGNKVFAGEVGITGTPLIDPTTGIIYFVTTISNNGVAEQWLRAIDVRTGNDVGPGSVKIEASVPGDGVGGVNGQIAFDPSTENQRAGLTKANGAILVAWGSFSDWGAYHGWLMAFDPLSLKLLAAFNPTTQFQANDVVGGPSGHGGAGSFWGAGAAPAVDAGGNIYVDASNGSFNADQGGNNYGDTLLKLQLNGNSFQIVDWFTPFDMACLDLEDLELGSGGVALLPPDFTNGNKLAVTVSKEGRLFLVNTDSLGKFNPVMDQIPEEFMIGSHICSTSGGDTEGPGWNRLYGNASYWNGNVYAGASSMPLTQYQFQNGLLKTTPTATSPTAYGLRGANTVVSANGTQNGIVWAYEKTTTGQGVLHAYDGNLVSTELWNSDMNSARDALGEGIAFSTPVVANGRVIVTYDDRVGLFGLLR
jgi:hypothetical protein